MKRLPIKSLALATALLLMLPARSDAQTFNICGSTWTGGCSSVTATAFQEGGVWKLRVVWENVSINEGTESIATRMLINVRAASDPDRALFSTDLSTYSGLEADGVTPRDPWDIWSLDDKGGKEKNKLGFEGWTGEIQNRPPSGRRDLGSCAGVVTTSITAFPCKPEKRDHKMLWVGIIAFGADYEPVLTNVAVQHQRIFSNTCPSSDPYCESDWAVVPEPITMLLVGTGLAGIGTIAVLRRRRHALHLLDE